MPQRDWKFTILLAFCSVFQNDYVQLAPKYLVKFGLKPSIACFSYFRDFAQSMLYQVSTGHNKATNTIFGHTSGAAQANFQAIFTDPICGRRWPFLSQQISNAFDINRPPPRPRAQILLSASGDRRSPQVTASWICDPSAINPIQPRLRQGRPQVTGNQSMINPTKPRLGHD